MGPLARKTKPLANGRTPKVKPTLGTLQIPVDSLLTQTQQYTRFSQTNCSLLLPSRERCREFLVKTVAVVNHKGGVGKTTAILILALNWYQTTTVAQGPGA